MSTLRQLFRGAWARMGPAIRRTTSCSRCGVAPPERRWTARSSATPSPDYLTAIVARPVELSRSRALLAPPSERGRTMFEHAWLTQIEILEVFEAHTHVGESVRERARLSPVECLVGPRGRRPPPPLPARSEDAPAQTLLGGLRSFMCSGSRCGDATTLCGLDAILAAAQAPTAV